MKIESRDTNVERLFTSDFLVIPRFQRPYSWDDENLEDFWNDVAQANGDDYFIGSMVLYQSGRQQYGVVDGQQRLTTITILLCVIRNAFLKLGSENLAKGLHALIERADRDSVNRYIVMTETSFPFFAEGIQKFGDEDFNTQPQREEKRLQAAFNFFEKKINGVLGAVDIDGAIAKEDKMESKLSRLKELRDSVLFLSLIRIELDNEDDAYLIFETLNTRGKDLALTDLLKNHFLKIMKGRGSVDSAKELWTKILSTINGSEVDIDPDTFFTHSWSSKFEATTQQKAYKKIKSAVSSKNAKDQLKGFLNDAEYYVSILNPELGWTKAQKDIIASLRAMRIFKISQHTPGVLSLVRAYRSGLISEKTLKRSLKAIEDFHFLFTAVTSSRSSGGISAMYSSFGRRLFEAGNSNEAGLVINDLIDKLAERKPSPSEFIAGFEQLNYTSHNTKQSNLVRYALQKIAHHQKLAFSDDASNLTIEHIHPQAKIDSTWTSELVGSLGNLILLTDKDNGKIKDDDFAKKQLFLKNLNGSVPEDILNLNDWTVELVQARTQTLAGIAYKEIWKIK